MCRFETDRRDFNHSKEKHMEQLIHGARGQPLSIQVHYNKRGAGVGLPWTLHVAGRCIQTYSVQFCGVHVTTVNRPKKKSNPRAWLQCRGVVRIVRGMLIVMPTRDSS
jgi:hypothetical protein